MGNEVRQIRVIIADDHLAVRKAIRKLLNQKQDILIVGESGNGKDTLRIVNELAPDVLLLDIDMPELDGVEVARRLRKQRSPVQILVVSGYSDQSYIRLVMNEGVSGYLVKDEAPAKLAEAIRQAARGNFQASTFNSTFSRVPA